MMKFVVKRVSAGRSNSSFDFPAKGTGNSHGRAKTLLELELELIQTRMIRNHCFGLKRGALPHGGAHQNKRKQGTFPGHHSKKVAQRLSALGAFS